jgi:hypothetical protein
MDKVKDIEMEKHFVEFFSPGSFVAENSTKPIDSWDVDKAVAMSKKVTERYGATPYAFRFVTRSRGKNDLDSTITKTSGMYYMNCKVQTVKDLDPVADEILISNMKCNKWDKIVTTTKGYRWSQPLNKGDVVL